ncbi:hypothetical protein AL755_04950 [Arthrobacter sp. ERGS1:01]|nr:hypothetical protein AL755_04950 [Arthrobacter sp. ERGS1:01]
MNVATKTGLWLLLAVTAGAVLAALFDLVTTLAWAFSGGTKITLPSLGVSTAAGSGANVLGPEVYGIGPGTSIELVVQHIPGDALALNVTASILGTLATIIVCLAIMVVSWRLARSVPFARSVTHTMAYVGGLLVLIGVVRPVLEGLGKLSIVNSLDNVLTVDSPIGQGSLDHYIVNSIDLLPIVLGVTLLLLTAVFAKGAQLQHDTEGLV